MKDWWFIYKPVILAIAFAVAVTTLCCWHDPEMMSWR